MIIEMRTYTLQPGTLAEVEKRFGEALPIREKHSKLAAFWHTEIGPLNQIIHMWAYDDFADRAARRAAMQADPAWQAFLPDARAMLVSQESRFLNPAPFFQPRWQGQAES